MVDRISHVGLRGSHGVLPSLGLPLVVVLTRVDILPADIAEEVVEARSQKRSEQRSNPVDPVVSGETAVDNIRTQGAGGIQGTTGVEVTYELKG